MRAVDFEYVAPRSVGAVVDLLRDEPGSLLLAGGQSLLPQVARRELTPRVLVDLDRVAGLDRLELAPSRTSVGAQVRLARIAADRAVAERHPGLAQALRTVGDAEVRRRSTVGGSLGHADPASQVLAAVTALDATVRVEGPRGARTIPVRGLVTGPHRTTLDRDELIVGLELPLTPHAQGFAVVGRPERGGRVCAAVLVDADGPRHAVLGGVGPGPVVVDRDALSLGAAEYVAAVADASSYLRQLAAVAVERAVALVERPVVR